jgi:hypothetical protein
MADMLGYAIDTRFFNMQIWVIYCSNPFFGTVKIIDMDQR